MKQESKSKPNTARLFIEKTQLAVADSLGQIVNTLSPKVRKVALIGMGVFIALICFGIIAQSIKSQEVISPIRSESITLPKDIFPTDSLTGNSTHK